MAFLYLHVTPHNESICFLFVYIYITTSLQTLLLQRRTGSFVSAIFEYDLDLSLSMIFLVWSQNVEPVKHSSAVPWWHSFIQPSFLKYSFIMFNAFNSHSQLSDQPFSKISTSTSTSTKYIGAFRNAMETSRENPYGPCGHHRFPPGAHVPGFIGSIGSKAKELPIDLRVSPGENGEETPR